MKISQLNHLPPSLKRLTILCTLIIGVRAGAEDWPQFRGPTGQGVSQAAQLPVDWDAARNISWRAPLDGKGWSSPVVFGGRIFLTTAVSLDETGNEQSLRAICINAATGTEIWQREVFRIKETPEVSTHAKNSFASPTPLVHRGRLYVHFGPYGTAALDLEGNVIWANNSIQYDSRHGGGGSPIVSGHLLIFNCDGVESPFVVALSLESGEVRWRTNRPDMEPERFSFSTPLEIEVASRRQIVSPGSHFVCGYDPESGAELWRVAYPRKWSVIPRPVFAHGLVYICTGYEGPAELLAIRPDGRGDVTSTHIVWRTDGNVPHTPSPVVAGDELFMISDNGIASCRDAATGQLHWRKRLRGDYSASPLNSDGLVYFTSEDGHCTVLAAGTEYEKRAENDLDEPTLASFAVDGDAILIRTAEHLYRIDDAQAKSL
jgi:outer membrane protein assembly factor BamB